VSAPAAALAVLAKKAGWSVLYFDEGEAGVVTECCVAVRSNRVLLSIEPPNEELDTGLKVSVELRPPPEQAPPNDPDALRRWLSEVFVLVGKMIGVDEASP
jgi:hypothetical protein